MKEETGPYRGENWRCCKTCKNHWTTEWMEQFESCPFCADSAWWRLPDEEKVVQATQFFAEHIGNVFFLKYHPKQFFFTAGDRQDVWSEANISVVGEIQPVPFETYKIRLVEAVGLDVKIQIESAIGVVESDNVPEDVSNVVYAALADKLTQEEIKHRYGGRARVLASVGYVNENITFRVGGTMAMHHVWWPVRIQQTSEIRWDVIHLDIDRNGTRLVDAKQASLMNGLIYRK